MKRILTVWKKELKDTLRDRRTLMSMIVMPMVLMPVLILGIGKFTQAQQKKIEEKTVRIGVREQNQPFIKFLSGQEKMEIIAVEGHPKDVIKSEKADIVILLPEGVETKLQAEQNIPIEVYRDSTVVSSAAALSRVVTAVSSYNSGLQAKRFSERQIDPKILSGLLVVPQDVSSDQERGGFGLGLLLPLFIVMWSIIGGQYTAIDVSAGEKERRTLESLLLTPVNRLELVLGKFLAVATAAITSVVVSLASFYFAFLFGFGNIMVASQGAGQAGANFSISIVTILLLFGISLLLVLMFSAVLLSIGIFAKNFKEAQSYIGPAYLIVVLPITILNIVPNFKPALWFFVLPVANALALFKELLMGTTDWTHIGLTFFSLVFYSALAIWVTTKIYQQEKVLVTN